MPTTEQIALVQRLIEGFRLAGPEHRLCDVRIPLSVLTDVVRASLDTSPFFPTYACPEKLGDGALIERRGKHHFQVHERFEVGQMRYSKVSSRSYLFLRSAVIRYLKHYDALLRIHRVQISTWC